MGNKCFSLEYLLPCQGDISISISSISRSIDMCTQIYTHVYMYTHVIHTYYIFNKGIFNAKSSIKCYGKTSVGKVLAVQA